MLTLNIGGVEFFTTRETLEKSDSFFRPFVREHVHADRLPFLDRDPTHFRYILNFMRGSRVLPVDNLVTLKEIRVEADFYSLSEMVSLCDRYISGCSTVLCELQRISQKMSFT